VEQRPRTLGERDPFLEEAERFVEWKITGLELLDDLLEARHCELEARTLSGGRRRRPEGGGLRSLVVLLHAPSSCGALAATTVQSSAPRARRTSTPSPERTSS